MSRETIDSVPTREEETLWNWLSLQAAVLSTILVGLLCGLAAFFSANLCDGDGTFSLDSQLARQSDYCRATHFPGFPDSLGSTLLVGAVYLTPVLIAALSGLAASTGRRRIGALGIGAAVSLAVAALVLSLAASDVEYVGV